MTGDCLTYKILERNAGLVCAVSCDDPKRAFLQASLMVSQLYKKRNIVPAPFDTDPLFYLEGVS